MAWDKSLKSKYIKKQEIFDEFKARYNLKSCMDGGEQHLLHLKDVLTLGKDRSPQDFYYIRRYRKYGLLMFDDHLPLCAHHHGTYFKTMDNRVIYVSHPYDHDGMDKFVDYVKDWEEKYGMKVEILEPGHSWYHENAYLVIITLTDEERVRLAEWAQNWEQRRNEYLTRGLKKCEDRASRLA